MPKTNKLGKDCKLATPREFQRVYQNATRFRHHGITVLVCNNDLTYSRIGISIPKKQISRSVDRNRIKRILRESFRINRNGLSVSLDMIFLAYSALLELTNLEIRACLEVAWTKLIECYKRA